MSYGFENLHYEEQTFSLFSYYPWHSSDKNEITGKILDFKKNSPLTVNWFQQCAEQAISYSEGDLLGIASPWYTVAIPGSRSGVPNTPCEQICAHLKSRFVWILHLSHALERTQSVPKSATAHKENRPRPSYETHKKTIRYVGPPRLISVAGILLIDDVLTTGNTFHACCDILRETTSCEHIFGLFLGRTQLPEQRN
jgi:hypothetical protein